MLDRVTDAMGRLGPVGDSEVMAANMLAVWTGDRTAMAAAARAHALSFSWDSSMEMLFGKVYPAAFEYRRMRQPKPGRAAVEAIAAVLPDGAYSPTEQDGSRSRRLRERAGDPATPRRPGE